MGYVNLSRLKSGYVLKQIPCANLQAATIMALSATEICLLQTLKIDMLYFALGL
jgi:hypothetical protein